MAPAEWYVRVTGDPQGGIVTYGLLFFSSQLIGLLMTYAADRSERRIIFTYACFSTACAARVRLPDRDVVRACALFPARHSRFRIMRGRMR